MKNFKLSRKLMMGAAVACALSVSLSSCSDDDDGDDTVTPPASTGAPEKLVGLDISSNTTWDEDTVYVLTSRIKVRPGATLTIQPGTIIKGSEGQGSNAKVLMVMRGAKIIADGTAAKPIIFTSVKDKIQPGQVKSPNLPNDLAGQWGGLAILGKATIAGKQGQDPTNTWDENQIEGVPNTDLDGRYGGNVDNDNSGILRYVSVRHGGTSIGSGNELNGISFGGVGSGTIVENIEIVANADDGLEFYGGTVNAKNVVVWNNGDDALDTDNGWVGEVDNFVIIGAVGSALELDGPEGTNTTITGMHTLKNGTVVVTRADNTTFTEDLVNYDENTNVNIQDVHFMKLKSTSPYQLVNSEGRAMRVATFSNITIDVPSGSTLANHISTADSSVDAAVSAGTTGKANTSVFTGWSWTAESGAMSGL